MKQPDLRTIHARDVMRTDVVTLSADDPIESALALFEDARISGAPVLGADGRMIGVLTLSDVARPEHFDRDQLTGGMQSTLASGEDDPRDDPEEVIRVREDYSQELLGRRRVGEWMTDKVVTVAPTAKLPEVCRTLAESRVHRVFVADGGRLLGVISTFDVIRVVARLT